MNETRIRVTPTEGRKVRHPDGRVLADGGEEVTRCAYWRRKEIGGDVTIEAVAAGSATSRRKAKA